MKNKYLFLLLAALPVASFAQKKITLMPSIGYAWRTAEIPDGIPGTTKDFIKQLKSGMNYDLAAYYSINSSLSLGAKFNLYTTSANGTLTDMDHNGNLIPFQADAKDKITFIGPSLLYSNINEETPHKLFYELALGLISYEDVLSSPQSYRSVKTVGSNLGLSGTIGYMYAVNPSFLIGPQLNVTAGTLTAVKIDGSPKTLGDDEKEGLTRVGLNLGAAFRF